MTNFSRPSVGRVLLTIFLSLFILSLPELMPVAGKLIVVILILFFFLLKPGLKGLTGGCVACFFSLVFAGLGQLYVGEYGKGFFFILGGRFAYMISDYSPRFLLFGIVLFIIAAVDAFSLGKRGFGIF